MLSVHHCFDTITFLMQSVQNFIFENFFIKLSLRTSPGKWDWCGHAGHHVQAQDREDARVVWNEHLPPRGRDLRAWTPPTVVRRTCMLVWIQHLSGSLLFSPCLNFIFVWLIWAWKQFTNWDAVRTLRPIFCTKRF